MTDTQLTEETFEYELRDISNYASTDPKGRVPDSKLFYMTENEAIEENYAYALNGNPHRLIKTNYL